MKKETTDTGIGKTHGRGISFLTQLLGSFLPAPGGFLLDVAPSLVMARAGREGAEGRKLPAGLAFPSDIKRSLTNLKHTHTFWLCVNGAARHTLEPQSHLSYP